MVRRPQSSRRRPRRLILAVLAVLAVLSTAGLAAVGLGPLLLQGSSGADPAEVPASAAGSGFESGRSLVSETADGDSAAADEPGEGPVQSAFETDGDFWWIWADARSIRLAWADGGGRPYGQMELARRALEARGERVLVMATGGIRDPGLVPAGLYVENGVEMAALNQSEGGGNFYLQPNGVFSITDGAASLEPTAEYADRRSGGDVGSDPDWALQSGPMLVIDGAANPLFTSSSTSTHIRNAVAVDADGRVLLIRSRGAVTMYELMERCLTLGGVDALYLDGTVSRLDQVIPGRFVFPNLPVASMIAVVESGR